MFEVQSRAIDLQRVFIEKENRWKRSSGLGGEGRFEQRDLLGRAQPLPRLLVGNDSCPRRVHPQVAIGVVVVPMGVDQVLNRVRAYGRQSFLNAGLGGG